MGVGGAGRLRMAPVADAAGGSSRPSPSTSWSRTPRTPRTPSSAPSGSRPDRAGHRRGHRHRHLRAPRRGDRRRRPGDHPLLRPRRRHLHVLGPLLRRAGVDDPGLRQRLHLRLRDDGRARRLDHRLGPDPRVRRLGRRGRRRLGPVLQRAARPLFGFSLPDALANPPGEDGGAFNLPAVFLVLAVAGC